jgi:diguanylate cyclase (GGDEF)-like protein
MTDLDYFKHVNDTYGHLVGDDVLRDTSDIIRKTIRKGDILGRYGGEEFVVMLDGTGSAEARETAEALRVKIHRAKIMGDKRDITASLGVASYPEHAGTVRSLVEKADKALYIAKRTGRNKHVVWDESMTELEIEKDSKQEFFSGENAKDAARTQSLYRLMSIAARDIPLKERIDAALDEILTVVGASDITMFTAENGAVSNSFFLTQPGRGTPQYNDRVMRDVITGRRGVCMVDWDNEKIDVSKGAGWESIAVAPAVYKGELKGVLYAGVPVRIKEFTPDEMAFIHNAAIIMASMLR